MPSNFRERASRRLEMEDKASLTDVLLPKTSAENGMGGPLASRVVRAINRFKTWWLSGMLEERKAWGGEPERASGDTRAR